MCKIMSQNGTQVYLGRKCNQNQIEIQN
uniref:Uncharacterized protein n=1 Tax=Arundo donax TaxID=35708 RepID=A0A0A9FW70_ARUDO